MISAAQLARLVDVGLAAAHRGRPAQARTLFQGLLAYNPGHAPSLLGLALTHLVVGDYGPAEAIVRGRVLSRNPADPEALALLGLALAFSGRGEEAAAVLERVPPEGPAGQLVKALENFSL
jgi:Flp pilus assembly protein TadD